MRCGRSSTSPGSRPTCWRSSPSAPPIRALAALLRRENKARLEQYLWSMQAVDLLREFPVAAGAEEWLSVLKRAAAAPVLDLIEPEDEPRTKSS